jgi:stage IV sporulation protein FB
MEEYDFYPPKPELIEAKPKGNLALTVFSIVLFVIAFLLVFTEEVNFIIYFLVVLLTHELGHFIMMKAFGYRNVRMLFIPLMGAFVQGSKDEYSQKQSLIVVGAGPFPGVLLGFGLILLSTIFHEVWMVNLGLLFLFLNLMNLIPLDPLDGGQLFKLLMKHNHDLFLMIFSLVSSLVLIAVGWIIWEKWMIIFGFIMGFRVRSLQNQYHLRKELRNEEVNYKTTYKLLSNKDFQSIKNVLLERNQALRTYVDNVSEEEAKPLLASQVNSVLVSPVKKDASLFFKLSIIFFWVAALITPLVLLLVYLEKIMEYYDWYFKAIQG